MALPLSLGWDQQPGHSNPKTYSSTSQKPVAGSLVAHPAPPCLGLPLLCFLLSGRQGQHGGTWRAWTEGPTGKCSPTRCSSSCSPG